MSTKRKTIRRKRVPDAVVQGVLLKSRRRCCLCYHLQRDDTLKTGQLAHIDHDRSNNMEDNLVYLCLEHHDVFDRPTFQTISLTPAELKTARSELYKAMDARDVESRGGSSHSQAAGDRVIGAVELLAAIGENDAVVLLGNLLVVKQSGGGVPGRVLITTLSDAQAKELERNQELLANPAALLDKLPMILPGLEAR